MPIRGPQTAVEIRVQHVTHGVSIAELARQYRVAPRTISDVVHGRTWSWCGGPRKPKRQAS